MDCVEGGRREDGSMPRRPTLPRIPRAELAQPFREVERYLETVDAFRAEDCEPMWRYGAPELAG